MLEALKVIILGIVEGITEWLPISSTGHLILVEEFVKLNFSQSYLDMFNVVIQLGAIMAVVVIYFHRLNPFSPKKTEKQKKMTLQLWVKVVIASIPAGVVGILFNDFIEEKFNNSYVVATMLIVVGVLNQSMFSLLSATVFTLIRCFTPTFSDTEFPPHEPHPSVRDGASLKL